MKKKLVSYMLLSVLLLQLTAGCASSPRGQYGQLQDVYLAAAVTLVDARKDGYIDEATFNNVIEPLISDGDRLLDQLDIATSAGEDVTETAAYGVLKVVVARLLEYVVQVRERRGQ